ncbi:uncharacterized protein BKA78DRAFT_356254 [Phyllosticta capitalensis]|uniref:uncharacterized protein n=1 Tax=Phyllosticta capitalensis TaxID=121624 RepID=UPI0031318A4D
MLKRHLDGRFSIPNPEAIAVLKKHIKKLENDVLNPAEGAGPSRYPGDLDDEFLWIRSLPRRVPRWGDKEEEEEEEVVEDDSEEEEPGPSHRKRVKKSAATQVAVDLIKFQPNKLKRQHTAPHNHQLPASRTHVLSFGCELHSLWFIHDALRDEEIAQGRCGQSAANPRFPHPGILTGRRMPVVRCIEAGKCVPELDKLKRQPLVLHSDEIGLMYWPLLCGAHAFLGLLKARGALPGALETPKM